MRAQVIIDAVPDELGTLYNLEIWDYDRGDRVRPLYTLSWRTTDTSKVDAESLLSHARHIAYVAYSRIGQELADVRERPGHGYWNSGPC